MFVSLELSVPLVSHFPWLCHYRSPRKLPANYHSGNCFCFQCDLDALRRPKGFASFEVMTERFQLWSFTVKDLPAVSDMLTRGF